MKKQNTKYLINLLLVALLPMAVGAETLFKEGTKWVIHEFSAYPTINDKNSRNVISLDKFAESGEHSLGFYYSRTPDIETTPFSEPQLFAFAKVEGNKVFFKPVRPNANDWLLLYDFDLKPGEGAYHYFAWGIARPSNPDPKRTYMKCVGIDVDPKYPGWEMMSFEEYLDDTFEIRLDEDHNFGTNYWIKDLSSVRGVTWNSGLGLVGGGATLLEVSCGDKIIYQHDTSSIQQLPNKAPIKIRMNGRALTVSDSSASNSLSIYNPSGQLIHQAAIIPALPTTIQLPQKGVYLLKIGQSTYKVKAS